MFPVPLSSSFSSSSFFVLSKVQKVGSMDEMKGIYCN